MTPFSKSQHLFKFFLNFFNFFLHLFFLVPAQGGLRFGKALFQPEDSLVQLGFIAGDPLQTAYDLIFCVHKNSSPLFYKYMHSLLRIFLFYLDATSLQIGFPSEQNFISYSVMTFPSAIALLCRSKVNSSTLQPDSGIDSSE